MKEYVCIEVRGYQQVGEKIREYLENGWHLHTYQATGHESTNQNSHFLLFERDSAGSNQ